MPYAEKRKLEKERKIKNDATKCRKVKDFFTIKNTSQGNKQTNNGDKTNIASCMRVVCTNCFKQKLISPQIIQFSQQIHVVRNDKLNPLVLFNECLWATCSLDS